MNLLTFCDTVKFTFFKSSGSKVFDGVPNVPYVFGQHQFRKITGEPSNHDRILKASELDGRIPNFALYDALQRPDKRLLFYNGCGGFGDQIMTWPVAKFLASAGFEITLLNDAGNDVCWRNFPWIKDSLVLPLEYDIFKKFPNFLTFDHLVNYDEHPGQIHPTDTLFEKIGLDHNAIDPVLKAVAPVFSLEELEAAEVFRKGRKIALFQLSGSNVLRSFTAAKAAHILELLVDRYPEFHWVAVYDEFVDKAFIQAAEYIEADNVEVVAFKELRTLWALTGMASLVVGMDSMMSHLAGVMHIPAVVYYGSTSPELRSKYYPTHETIWKRELCPEHAGCHCASMTFPKYCPPSNGKREMCEIIANTDAEDILKAAERTLSRHNAQGN